MALAARRVGAETSATRALILKATEDLLLEQGHSNVSTRRVATRAGLKPSLVHYYFPTTDDLLIEVGRRGAEESDRMIEEAFKSDKPLHALWQFFIDTSRTAMAVEFIAMANHREAIRSEIAQHSEQMRKRQAEVLEKLFGDKIREAVGCSGEVLTLLMAGIGRTLVMENGLGVTSGHADTRATVELWLDRLAQDQNQSEKKQA